MLFFILPCFYLAPSEAKINIEAIKAKVRKAKTKKLGAPSVNPVPQTKPAYDKKKKNKG